MSKILIIFTCVIISQSSFANLLFSKDGRPYDGQLNEIQIIKTKCAPGYSDATLSQRIAFWDRMNGQAVDNTKVLSTGMNCLFKFVTRRNQVIKEVVCTRDDRPADGALNQFIFDLNTAGLYDVIHKMAIYSRIQHREIKSEAVIGRDLELK